MIDDVLGKLIADKYRVESLIRESETGDLFAAHHEVRETPVTLKILPMAVGVDARWTRKFIDESRAIASLTHPNILNISDFGTDASNVTYAVYEGASTETLRDRITDEGIEQNNAIAFARAIANGVTAAHEKKVVLGRLSPENVFLGADDKVKVYGFGGDVKYVPRDADPRYLAPEQLTQTPNADERSDVYSLGVILYEMLAGQVPFDGKKSADVLKKIDSEPPAPLSAFRQDLHPEIEPIILTALAADPERRYQTVSAFADDLALVAGQPAKTQAAAVGKQRNIWQTAAVALAGVLVLAIALIYATSARKTDPTSQLQADASSLPVQPIGPATGAQEESLSKLPDLTAEEVLAMQQGTMDAPPGTLPGGDGYNAWASGAPPLGAPAPSSGGVPGQFAPPGQTVTIDPNNGSQFMPQSDGIILVPVPVANANVAVKPTPTPKTPAANTAPAANTTKPLVAPTPKAAKPATDQPANKKPGAKPGDSELEL